MSAFGLGFAGPQYHAVLARPIGRAGIYLQSVSGGFVVTFDFRSGTWTRVAGGTDVNALMSGLEDGWFLCGVSTTTTDTMTDLRAGACYPETDAYAEFTGCGDTGFDLAELVSRPGVDIRHDRLRAEPDARSTSTMPVPATAGPPM